MIYQGEAFNVLKQFPDQSINTCVTSPPYWGHRDYNVEGQLGLEDTPEEYVERLAGIFAEVKRVLRDDGTLWLNLGDSYAGSNTLGRNDKDRDFGSSSEDMIRRSGNFDKGNLKSKDLVGIPWRVAFALQDDGWYLRNDIIWHKCLSGGTNLYAKTQKGIIVSTLKDLTRLDPETVKLWDGEKWNQVKKFIPQKRNKQPISIELRSGEKINCTPNHKFPTKNNGLKKANELEVGDCLCSKQLPNSRKEKEVDKDFGWFAGYYLAEGSRDSRDRLQFSSHKNEKKLHNKLNRIVNKYNYSVREYNGGGKAYNTIISSNMLNGLLKDYISGNNAKNKRLKNKMWKQSNTFLDSFLKGYLDGDGHYDKSNNRWRIGFTRNDQLAGNLRVLCARLNYQLRLKPVIVKNQDREHKAYQGEIRKETKNHFNQKDDTEIINISKSNGRKFWDIVLEKEPHKFCLASGVMSHNSNPMPESVTDRCTTSHEHIFLLAKSKQYYYDQDAIKEPSNEAGKTISLGDKSFSKGQSKGMNKEPTGNAKNDTYKVKDKRNKRDVWNIATKSFSDAHFAVYPPDLIRPCVKAGCPDDGIVLDPFFGAGTTGLVAKELSRNYVGIELNEDYIEMAQDRIKEVQKELL